MENWKSKCKKEILTVICISLIFGMSACSSKNQESVQSSADNGSSLESSGLPETAIDTETPTQYVYSSETITFTEYGDRVDVCDVASRGEQVYILMEVKNWEEGDADDQPSEVFYQVMSCAMDGSQRSVSDKITLQAEAGNITEIHISDAGCVAALCQPSGNSSMKLLFWDVFRDISWEKETGTSEGKLFLQGEDMIVLCVDNGNYTTVSYDKSGKSGKSIKMDAEVFEDAQAVYLQPDGCFFVVKMDMKGATYGQVYDPASDLAEQISLPDKFSRYQVFQGAATDVLLCDTVGVYGYDVGDAMPVTVATYIDAGLDIERFQLVRQIDETHFAGTYYEGINNVLGLFSRTKAPDDQVIVLGVFNESDIHKDRILDFNREDNGYRITVKQYVAYSDELDAYTQLNNDILAGNMPDILAIDTGATLRNLISEGLLADVGELLSQDAELSDVEFMENVFDALRVDSVLYQIVPSFAVDTMIAKQSIIGDRTGWSMEEFSQVVASLPEGMDVVSEMSGYGYMADYMDACADEIIDYASGTCHFNSPDFIAALEFAATLPEKAETYGDGEYMIDHPGHMFDSRYLEDKVLLQPVSIVRIRDLCSRINGALGEDGAYVGFPSDSREGGVFRIYGTNYVLSSQSSHLEGAWSFARYLLTEDYQSGMLDRSGGLPTRKEVFEKNVQDAAEYEGFCFINDEYRNLPALTQEQIDRAVDFIEGVHHFTFDDEAVMNIIYEEAESYFQGQKDVESVADVIQNRVELYLHLGSLADKQDENIPLGMEERYKAILLGDGDFVNIDRSDQDIRLSLENIKEVVSDEDWVTGKVIKFTIVDLDGNGENEIVLWIQSNNGLDYGFEILYFQDQEVYGFTLPYRGFMDLKTDGTFYSSGGLDNRGIRRLRLSERGYTIEEVSDSEFQEEKTDVEWYDLTPDNVELAFKIS